MLHFKFTLCELESSTKKNRPASVFKFYVKISQDVGFPFATAFRIIEEDIFYS
jgi:hypothetical protein